MSDVKQIIDPFGIFKELVETTAQEVVKECGFLKKKIIIMSDDNKVGFIEWDDSSRQLLDSWAGKIKILAFVEEMGEKNIQLRIVDSKTKYGMIYLKKEDNSLIETRQQVNFDDIGEICKLLEVTNAEEKRGSEEGK